MRCQEIDYAIHGTHFGNAGRDRARVAFAAPYPGRILGRVGGFLDGDN